MYRKGTKVPFTNHINLLKMGYSKQHFAELREVQKEENYYESYETDFSFPYHTLSKRDYAEMERHIAAGDQERKDRAEDAASLAFIAAYEWLDKVRINAEERKRIEGQMRRERDPNTFLALRQYLEQLKYFAKKLQRQRPVA